MRALGIVIALLAASGALAGCVTFSDMTPGIGLPARHERVCSRARCAQRALVATSLATSAGLSVEIVTGHEGHWSAPVLAVVTAATAAAALVAGEARGSACEPPDLDSLPDAEYDAATRSLREGRDADLAPRPQ